MIALDLCQPHYQVLFINYLKFTKKKQKKNVKDVRKKEKSNQRAIELGLKIIKLNDEYKEC